MNITPICPYCNTFSIPVTGKEIYPARSNLHYKNFYKCPSDTCDAYVGCHPDSKRPLGRLANKELRQAKSAAHRAFDPFWQGSKPIIKRAAAYKWLGEELNLKKGDVHIGLFDVAMCNAVMRICAAKRKELGL